MNTIILYFKKTVTIANYSTEAEIEVTFGDYRKVDQINTSNEAVYEAGHKFENGDLSLEELLRVLINQGYHQ